MRSPFQEEILLSGAILLMAAIGPNVFPVAQAGLANMFVLATRVLIPSVILLGLFLAIAAWRGHRRLFRRTLAGGVAGLLATFGLEAFRATSFHVFEGMPGDLPRLMGVLLTDRFMLGPSTLSDALGFAYHFWNGACFGIIFTVILGRRSMAWAFSYGQLIGVGFLLSPVVASLGIGFMGKEMPSMPVTVVLAHAAYGILLGWLTRRWLHDEGWLLSSETHEI